HDGKRLDAIPGRRGHRRRFSPRARIRGDVAQGRRTPPGHFPMILEGIVTTISPEGVLNIAPMGPAVGDKMDRFLLRPYRTAQTYKNLKSHGEGVFHVTDDVLLLAESAIGSIDIPPPCFAAQRILGYVLAGACRYYEFRVAGVDDREDRTRIEVEVVF